MKTSTVGHSNRISRFWQETERPKRRKWAGAAIAVVIFVVAFHILLPIAVKAYANHKLAHIGEYRGEVGDVSIHLWRGAYSAHDVFLVKTSGGVPVPFFRAKRIDLSAHWGALLMHGAVVADVEFFQPQINFVAAPNPKDEQIAIHDASWQEKLKSMSPISINRLEVHDGEVHFRNYYADPKIDLYLRHIEATATNLTNSDKLSRTLKSTIDAHGQAMNRGGFDTHLTADPFAKDPTFEIKLRFHAYLPELNDFFRHYLAVKADDGRIDVYIEGAAAKGRFKGYVKPLLERVSVLKLKENQGSVGEAVKGIFVQISSALFKNPANRDLAAKVDLSGPIKNPDINVAGAIGTFLGNAFFKAVLPGFEGAAKLHDVDKTKIY